MPTLLARARFWTGIIAVILIAGILLPPAGSDARQYAFVEALQFVIFAVVGPALLVLAIPWRALAPRLPVAGPPLRPAVRATTRVTAFIALAVIWRLPVTVNALARHPALVAVELITLLAAGTGIWVELTGTRPAPEQLPRPARAAIAAVAMWTMWILAYLTGMSETSWFAAYHHGTPGGLGAAADQQIAVAILWVVPALCFIPVLYVRVVAWLASGTSPAGNHPPAASVRTLGSWPRPPRGWRSPNT